MQAPTQLPRCLPAALSPDLGVTKKSPYPLLWEHEVKRTAACDRRPLTSPTPVTSHPYTPPWARRCTQGHYSAQVDHPRNLFPGKTATSQGPLQKQNGHCIDFGVHSPNLSLTHRNSSEHTTASSYPLVPHPMFLNKDGGGKKQGLVRIASSVDAQMGVVNSSCKSKWIFWEAF